MNDHSRRTVIRAVVVSDSAVLGGLSLRGLAQGVMAAVPTTTSKAALATSSACATLTEELTQGLFWVDERLNRSDVRTDTDTGSVQPGVPLTLTINLRDAGASCAPQAGAFVDIWHANAQGNYSDVSGAGNPDNRGLNWLRGYQVSDDAGSVTFTTVMPGYYVSRTIHIHFRVRLTLADDSEVNFTAQLFFAESVNNAVLATSAYQKSQARDTSNSTDSLYDDALLVPVTGGPSGGYAGSFTVNLDFGGGTDDGGRRHSTSDDTVVDAKVLRASVVARGNRRVVKVELRAYEKVVGRVRLVRDDDVLAVKTWGWLPKGKRVLRMRVPGYVPAGRARVMVTLADAAGNFKVARKQVNVPRR